MRSDSGSYLELPCFVFPSLSYTLKLPLKGHIVVRFGMLFAPGGTEYYRAFQAHISGTMPTEVFMASKRSLLLIAASIVLAQHHALAAKTCEKLFKNSSELEFIEIIPIRAAKSVVKVETAEIILNEAQVKFIARSHNLFVGKFPPRLAVLTQTELQIIARQVEKNGGGRMVELLAEEKELLKSSQVQTDPRELVQLMGLTKKGKKILSAEVSVQGRTQEALIAEAQEFIARHQLKEVVILLTHPLLETKLANETALISPLKINELEAAQKISSLAETQDIPVRIRASLPAGHAYEASFVKGVRTAQ